MGRLGTSLAAALRQAGYSVEPDTSSDAHLTFVTVPDRVIAQVADARAWRSGEWVVHCSGALGREHLATAEAAGALTGCFHPLQTFPSRSPEPERFKGIAVGIEGPPVLAQQLEQIAMALGSKPFRLEGVDRALYHAAAVVASNHLIALASAATRLWELAGITQQDGRSSLAPLITAAASNVAAMPLADALTGPVARGDVETVVRHLTALELAPELRDLYRQLSLELLRLPLRIDESRRTELESVLRHRNRTVPEDTAHGR